MVEHLSTYQTLMERAKKNWPSFLEKREKKLKQMQRDGGGSEKIAENIVEYMLTEVLDWCLSNVNNQIQYSDILLTHMGLKRAIIETKRPTKLAWNEAAIQDALAQARRYADEQRVQTIAVSDGYMFYAADIVNGGLQERLYVNLHEDDFPEDLYWFSVHGISRARDNYESQLNKASVLSKETILDNLLHPKYKIPARCFGYVGDATDTKTWKLPYLNIDNTVDTKRLSGAIRCITSNYRGSNVKDIPDSAVPNVLKRFYEAAGIAGKLPHQNPKTTETYKNLAELIKQVK